MFSVQGGPLEVLQSGTLTEAGQGRETGSFDIPRITINFREPDGSIGDISSVSPIRIDFTSDSEIALPATGNVTITGESGTVFSIRVNSDADIPEPASLAIFASALIGLGLIRRRRPPH